MSKKFFIFIGLLIIVLLGYYFINSATQGGLLARFHPVPAKFMGVVVNIQGDNLNMRGKLSGATSLPKQTQSVDYLSVKLNSKVIYKKISITLPTPEELKDQGKSLTYNINDAKHVDSLGSLDDLKAAYEKNLTFVEVNFDFYGNSLVNSEAKEVTYKVISDIEEKI